MLRIGEVAKQFDISNRTLRYWEEMGILKSSRTENGYRFYDNESAARIKQIVLLRKLKMPLADIERVFLEADYGVAIDALNSHLESLKQNAAVFDSLVVLVEKLIQHIKESKCFDQVFSNLEAQVSVINSYHVNAPKNKLSERIVNMSGKEQQLDLLEPIKVIS